MGSEMCIRDSVKRSALAGFFTSYMFSPPCGTFSIARTGNGGPSPLRGEAPPERYGLPDLTVKQKKDVQLGPLLGERAAEIAEIATQHPAPWLAEPPLVREGAPSVFKLPRWLEVFSHPQVLQDKLDQCEFEDEPKRLPAATFTKATSIGSNVQMSGLVRSCSHQAMQWVVPAFDRTPLRHTIAAHPPLRGKQLAWKLSLIHI